MKIERIEANVVRLPLEEPLAAAPPFPGMMREFLTLRLRTDDGIEGIGLTGFGGGIMRALKAAVEDLGALIIGEDPLRADRVLEKIEAASEACGPGGFTSLALAAFDIALWDIRGKAFNVPLARLLGGRRERVPAYASGALMRTSPLDKVERAAGVLVEKGYRQIKTQMAVEGLTWAQEIERIRVIRKAVGPEVALMVDINQRWGVHEAIAVASRIEDLGLAWLEDPTVATDHQGLAKIADALTMPVCAGEYLYGIEPHRQSLAHHSVDIVMIDVLRAGGITPWMKIAAMAEAFNRPVVSHLLPEIHVHLVAAAPNALVVEYMPWTRHLFENPPMPERGEMTVPPGPGLGLTFAPDLFKQYGVA